MIDRDTIYRKLLECERSLKDLSQDTTINQNAFQAKKIQLLARREAFKELYDDMSEIPYQEAEITFITNN